jgi:hypothetical protein
MATGWPMKTTYANGDVYSASDVNDITGTINLLGSSVAYTAGKNRIINGNFDIWQRGTSFAAVAAASYSADRWKTALNGTGPNITISRDTSVPTVASQYSLKMQQLSTSFTSVTEFAVSQLIETTNALTLFGKSVTLSFWYRSNLTGSHYVRFYTGGQTGGTDTAVAFTVNAANTWEYKTVTTSAFSGVTAVVTAATSMGAQIDIGRRTYLGGTSTTIAANDYIQLSQMQIEVGTATPFQTSTGTIQGELAACQRYYWRTGTDNVYGAFGNGFCKSTTSAYILMIPPVTMRVPTTAIDGTTVNADYATYDGVTVTSVTGIGLDRPTKNVISLAVTGTGLTTYRPIALISNNTLSAYLGFTAEL